ncbi:DUF1444 family protein [Anatilimnocola floriformis]|uniref:DUF1444 family protein n=1 Tax=Anatilimnocola floriformis TaxID=2948575 RepID=UPI0020C48D41|nr:DUF1444 family protein [Anatilimnocola floriformis]
MGWLDYFFGPPGKDAFAQLVLAEIAKAKIEGQLTYDAEQFYLHRQEGGFVNLAHIYREYCEAPRKKRATVLQQFIKGSLATRGFEIPADFDDVQPDLLPIVRSRYTLESVRLQAELRGTPQYDIPQQLVGDHLALSLVYDLPHTMRSIGQEELDTWNVSFYEAIEAARHNLAAMNNFAVASLDDRVFVTATGDNYDASRMLLTDVIRTFPVRGQPVAMVPNADTVLITGHDDAEGLQLLANLAAEAFQKPKPISGALVKLTDDEWQSWLPETDSPAYKRLHELLLRSHSVEYAGQKELLDQLHASRNQDLVVPAFNAMQENPSGRMTSYCVWQRGLRLLLPVAEEVFFMGGDAQSPELLARAPWERVQQIVGELMHEEEAYPPRWRVEKFPGEHELSLLGKG